MRNQLLELTEWKEWFAWYPVITEQLEIIWLQTVLRTKPFPDMSLLIYRRKTS